MEAELTPDLLSQSAALVARTLGLHFPPERHSELQRGIALAAGELGFEGDAEGCLRWLAGARELSMVQIQTLAAQLTVGETYLFREPRQFDFLTGEIVPQLLQRDDRRLRIWSAGCCTGEEVYSLAIALHRAVPDLKQRQLTLLGTDINPRFLRKAEAGVFGNWSFRDAPAWLKGRYFRQTRDGHFEISPEIRRLVCFAPLNLADDSYAALGGAPHEIDIICCRNVLMYFAPPQIRRTIEKMSRAQPEGGWLIVGSSEMLHLAGTPYAPVHAPGTAAYRKRGAGNQTASVSKRPMVPPRAVPAAPDAQKRFLKAAARLDTALQSTRQHADALALNQLARELANQGRLKEALQRCNESIAADKCSAASQYLRALIFQGLGELDDALGSLRSALYLDPHFVVAHVALGTLARDRGQMPLSRTHFKQALQEIQRLPPEAIVPESDGISACQLTNIVHSLMAEGSAP